MRKSFSANFFRTEAVSERKHALGSGCLCKFSPGQDSHFTVHGQQRMPEFGAQHETEIRLVMTWGKEKQRCRSRDTCCQAEYSMHPAGCQLQHV